MNLLAVVAAAGAAWVVGGAWYGLLGASWLTALGKTRAELPSPIIPMLLSIVADLVLACILASILGPAPGIARALVMAALIWLGFVATTIVVNNAFAGRSALLSLIDAGHWLAALLAAGAVLGAMG